MVLEKGVDAVLGQTTPFRELPNRNHLGEDPGAQGRIVVEGYPRAFHLPREPPVGRGREVLPDRGAVPIMGMPAKVSPGRGTGAFTGGHLEDDLFGGAYARRYDAGRG